jgi:hexokinase
MADVPKDLLQEIKRLEELFSVDKTKLKAITEHFISELDKGPLLITATREPYSHCTRSQR